MADKKLNEVTKVTDMAYVPVIMADGSIGQIAKADLASVVAGQNTKPWSFARADTSSTSTYYITIDGYNEAFDHNCRGGGICIVSSQESKTQILYTDWGVKYRFWGDSNWSEWFNIYNP